MVMRREADEEVQFAVDLYQLCKEFGCLPRPGGLLDQDFYHVILLKHTAAAFGELQKRQMPST